MSSTELILANVRPNSEDEFKATETRSRAASFEDPTAEEEMNFKPTEAEKFVADLKQKADKKLDRKISASKIVQDTNVYAHEINQYENTGMVVQNENGRRIYFFDGKIEHIHSIDMKGETFEGTFHFYLTYLATTEEIRESRRDKEKWAEKHPVTIKILNAKGDPSSIELIKKTFQVLDKRDYEWPEHIEKKLGFNPSRGIWLRSRWKFSGAILEEFELYSFPFDCQDLQLKIEVRDDRFSTANIVPMPRIGPYLQFTPNHSTLSDFLVSNICREFRESIRGGTRNNQVHPQVIMSVKLRRGWFSQSTLLLSIVVLAGCALAVFSIPESDTGNRLNYLMTLILTDVATQQNIRSTLDDFTYMTALDQFIVSGILFQVACLAWCAIPYYPAYSASLFFTDMSLTNEIATWSFSVAFIIWLTSWVVRFALLQSMESMKLHQSPAAVEELYASADSEAVYECWPAEETELERFKFETSGTESSAPNMVGFGRTKKIRMRQSSDSAVEERALPQHHNEIKIDGRKDSMEFSLLFQVIISMVWIGLTLGLAVAFTYVPSDGHVFLMWSQTGAFFLTCFLVAALSGVARSRSVQPHLPMRLKVCSQYYHDFGIIIGGFIVAVVGWVVAGRRLANARLLSMYISMIALFGVYFIADCKTLGTEKPIHRFAPVRNDHKCSWIPVFVLQGVHGLMLCLPVLVVQSESMSGYVHALPAFGWLDVVGLVLVGCACLMMLLSAFVKDPYYVWSRLGDELEENDERIATALRPTNLDVPEPTHANHCSQASLLDHRASSLPNVLHVSGHAPCMPPRAQSAPELQLVSDGEIVEEWSIKDLSPYRYIQFPFFLSECMFSSGLWLMSVSLYRRNHPFPLISMLSPVVVGLFHWIIYVPVLQTIGQTEFNMKSDYLEWRSTTYSLFCTVRCAFCWQRQCYNRDDRD